MSAPASAGRIEVGDVDEANYFAAPWDVILRQMSSGRFRGWTDYVTINGILIYREHWSHRVMAAGATPTGYFVFGGPASPGIDISWCGVELASENLAYGRSSTEVDFVLPDHTDHVVLLVPDDLLRSYLGEESADAVLRDDHLQRCDPGVGQHLLSLIGRLVERYRHHGELLADARIRKAVEWQLLGSLMEVLFGGRPSATSLSPRKRFLAYRRALRLAEGLCRPLSVPELAKAAGVSQRVLELGFREELGISPRRYLLWSRMNALQRDLRSAGAKPSSVTEIASRWGFEEMGRTAAYYKELFGELPSETLARDPRRTCRRLADILFDQSSQQTIPPEN